MGPRFDDDDDESWLDTRPDPVPAPAKRGRGSPLWVVHMSHSPVGLERGLREGFICVGWVESGDLRQYPTTDSMKREFLRTHPGAKAGLLAHWTGDARRFAFEMGVGDLFVLPITGADDIHVGVMTGDYAFAAHDPELVAADAGSLRAVRWLARVGRGAFTPAARRCFNSEHTVHSGDAHRDEVLGVLGSLGVSIDAGGHT